MRKPLKTVLFIAALALGNCCLAVFASERAAAGESFLGVYGLVSESTMVADQFGVFPSHYTVFAPLSHMRVRVSLANEEGQDTLFLVDGLSAVLGLELSKDGQRLPAESLEARWADKVERYSYNGEPVPETGRRELLEPGVGLSSEVTLARRDGRPFFPGAYELVFRVRSDWIRFSDNEAWIGRGGLGGQRFLIREPASLADRKHHRAIMGMQHLLRGDSAAALEEFLAMVDLDPEDLSAYSHLGLAYFSMKDHEAAIWCFEKALPEVPDGGGHSFLPTMLATSYVSVGERSKAIELLSAFSSPAAAEAQVQAIRQRLDQCEPDETGSPQAATSH